MSNTASGLRCGHCQRDGLTQTWSGMCPPCYRAHFGDVFVGGTVQSVPGYSPPPQPPLVDLTAILAEERDRFRDALREIAAGKLACDNENPIGHYASMAGRFIGIAQRALVPNSTPGEGGDRT